MAACLSWDEGERYGEARRNRGLADEQAPDARGDRDMAWSMKREPQITGQAGVGEFESCGGRIASRGLRRPDRLNLGQGRDVSRVEEEPMADEDAAPGSCSMPVLRHH